MIKTTTAIASIIFLIGCGVRVRTNRFDEIFVMVVATLIYAPLIKALSLKP